MAGQETILVTGGAGFIGSNLCRKLVGLGYRVISIDNYFSGSRVQGVDGVEYRTGHTKDIDVLVPERVDRIYHLGEYSRVEQSVLEPEIVHDLNTVGTRAVVESWRRRKCKLIYAGSSTKFGDGGAARSTSPYAATKAANTELIKRVGDAEQLPYAITYFYNVYGPGERTGVYGTVVESFKQMYLRGTPLTVVAPGTQERNFTHVDDIVDGLILVGDKGHGDEYGLGNERAYTVLEVAELFGTKILMVPPRQGNRLTSALDASRSREIGWHARRSLEEYVKAFVAEHQPGAARESRILVFSTTFYPVSGPAEEALLSVIEKMPDVRFDIVTAAFSRRRTVLPDAYRNAHVHRVGWGIVADKYMLPVLGYLKARELSKEHTYLFAWSLMASYAALAAVFTRRARDLPVLITLADQDLARVPRWKRIFLSAVLGDADQVYGDSLQEKTAEGITSGPLRRRSMGHGDAFANAIRFVYSTALRRDTI